VATEEVEVDAAMMMTMMMMMMMTIAKTGKSVHALQPNWQTHTSPRNATPPDSTPHHNTAAHRMITA